MRFWAYQLESAETTRGLARLRDSHYDMLVIDQVRSQKGENKNDNRTLVETLRKSRGSSGDPKIVLAYLNVGEAESYRRYWRVGWRVGEPEWIVAADPDGWDGNYPVKFWRPEWKRIVYKYVDEIIEDGFDGIYLDWLEAYSFGPVARAAESEGLDPRAELVEFTREIAARARSQKQDLIIIAQNAAELGRDKDYVDVFDGVAQEEIWYAAGRPVPGGETREYLRNLKRWQNLGRPVFDVEYTRDRGSADRAYALGSRHGFKTYVTLRDLAALTKNPPAGY